MQVAALPCMADDTVFAVHAPHGTALEVPDPDGGVAHGPKHYRQFPVGTYNMKPTSEPCAC